MDFAHAPCTKGLLLLTLSSSLLAKSMAKGAGGASWAFLSQHFAMHQTFEAIFGMLLLYSFRIFERRLGTSKFSAFAAFTLLLGGALRSALLRWKIAADIASGPFAIIFACFPLLVREIPGSTKFTVMFVPVSDRTKFYVLGLQLAAGSAPGRWAALCGILAGVAYVSLGKRAIDVPSPIAKVCGAVLLPLIQGGSASQPNQAWQAHVAQRRAEAAAAALQAAGPQDRGTPRDTTDVLLPPSPLEQMRRHMSAPARVRAPPSETDIQHVQAVCARSRIDVIAALQRANNNVELATNILLDTRDLFR